MQQFIEMATSALGTSEQVARTLTGGLLDVISRNAPAVDVSALLARWAAQQAGPDVVRRALSSVPGVSVLLASPDLR